MSPVVGSGQHRGSGTTAREHLGTNMGLRPEIGYVVIYISGPMSDFPQHNFPAFNAADELLRTAGYDVFNPATCGVIRGWTWSDYLRDDLSELVYCAGVALLPGWQLSRGARLEFHVARELGMIVESVDWWLAAAESRQAT